MTPDGADALLEVRQLSVRRGGVSVMHDVSLRVSEGEAVAVIGANGAGKTSLLMTIAGVLQPASGSISLAGEPIGGRRAHEVARMGLRLVPENRQLFTQLRVEDNLVLGATGMPKNLVQQRLDEVYARFPILSERRRQLAGNLSGGEQQMAAIGRAVISSPRILLLDEPSTGLAPKMVDEVFRLLEMLRREGTTILLVEQIATMALEFADRAYVLELGRVTLEGRASDLALDPAVEQAYLGGHVANPGEQPMDGARS